MAKKVSIDKHSLEWYVKYYEGVCRINRSYEGMTESEKAKELSDTVKAYVFFRCPGLENAISKEIDALARALHH